MKVRDVVHLKTDRPGQEALGRVVAVNTRARRLTIMWENAKITEEPSENIMLWDPAYQN